MKQAGRICFMCLLFYRLFENREDDILESSITARLLSFPNVIVTSHQGFLTEEALEAISRTTLDNARDYENGTIKDINAV